jgi:ABC-type lipoprotein release transport system permease subunit
LLKQKNILIFLLFFLIFSLNVSPLHAESTKYKNHTKEFSLLLKSFSDLEDRSCGSIGAKKASHQIKAFFKNLGFSTIDSHSFFLPSRLNTKSTITLKSTGQSFDLDPFLSNAISPDTLSNQGITGRVVHVGKGKIKDFNNKTIKDSIVLMDLDSAKNWITALSLGAKAVIYLYDTADDKFLFQDKLELTPVKFPRFLLSRKRVKTIFPGLKNNLIYQPDSLVTLHSDLKWNQTLAENIYCLVPGKDEKLKNELIIVEGFYDTAGFVPLKSPGADQACSIATLLDLAEFLKKNPPKRSILLVATSGYGNSLAGMREMIWSLDIKSKQLKELISRHKNAINSSRQNMELLSKFNNQGKLDNNQLNIVQKVILDVIKSKIDDQSNQLMQLRLQKTPDVIRIKELAAKRVVLKRLEGKNDLATLTLDEKKLLEPLIPVALNQLNDRLKDSEAQIINLTSAKTFKKLVRSKKTTAIISLHLSSHGNGFGAFNEGWLYDIKNSVNTFSPYVKINELLIEGGKNTALSLGIENMFKDTLRPSLHRPWQSYFKDRPALGGEVSRLAGFLGLNFVTTNDARQVWNTPSDTFENVDLDYASKQSLFISNLISDIATAPKLSKGRLPRNGFATLKGRASFVRYGAVFADAPAPDSVVLAFQGPGIFHSMVDKSGDFLLKGVATKKMTLHKVILEGYKFDPATGDTIWAVDKKKTTKARYRIKIKKKYLETELIMFKCSQTTILNLLDPRTFNYMTKLQVLDARTDAMPIRHWYSRIDTKSSTISSIYLQPGTRLKLALSDTLLTKKLILINSDKNTPDGYGVDDSTTIAPTQYLAARDMWALLNPRIDNLENKGINNPKILSLKSQGNQSLKEATQAFANMKYDKFFSASATALALAGRVYEHVETIQKDVLYGVLFYIAMFAPFAFCLERFLFAFINIYKRIVSFLVILVCLIIIIYNVHPAFELAYSPVVIILAFFIIGLSSMVTWIIFYNFENEMKQLQQRGASAKEGEISLIKAFRASFFMGINNLRRRRMRTVLTCITLIILTFTLMSFTSVKNIRKHSKLFYSEKVPYQGLLVKKINWNSLPAKAFESIENTMSSEMIAAPRAWLETKDRTKPTKIPLKAGEKQLEANGLIGLSSKEQNISKISDYITQGQWFLPQDRYSIILPERMAKGLGIDNLSSGPVYVNLWSIPFKVIGIFSGQAFDKEKDLDGETISPAIFPDEVFQKTTEAEMEAFESGDDIKGFQSRYKHIPFDQTIIIDYETLMSLGGSLKSIALKSLKKSFDNNLTFQMTDRFGLWLFSGEKNGVFVYSASDRIDYSGLPNVIIPILISIFIVLNTMIGSVQERKREIGIYTSIGMAPSHVSVIFIAEAISYAVMSVVLGYILAQTIVTLFAGTTLLNGITVNYSSLGGVFAMVMVMLVVILSSIYPSRIASHIAIPDVEKSWTLAKAKKNTIRIELPFLIKDKEKSSIAGFLYNLFDMHREVSHGIFSVGRLKLITPDKNITGDDYEIDFVSWLAPFDLGVMQHVKFNFKTSSHFKGYLEIDMTINREAGEQNSWWRINKRFVNLIRKQLLTWRAMDHTEKQAYEKIIEPFLKKQDKSIA